ncbi:hypothetical protein [Pseudonocardia sp. WMMC193]|uniref:hypothetical protein n=1 Tax=Pseudonocardia sp. WMMC193 TaxID=2911965 RepID=UPI001F1A3168|nr:hypothetical protein [Pseudonocardia sp. WMMC193]MCF7547209.1 hypothetical protein [Pseudonocardia sp. WMMC193]
MNPAEILSFLAGLAVGAGLCTLADQSATGIRAGALVLLSAIGLCAITLPAVDSLSLCAAALGGTVTTASLIARHARHRRRAERLS